MSLSLFPIWHRISLLFLLSTVNFGSSNGFLINGGQNWPGLQATNLKLANTGKEDSGFNWPGSTASLSDPETFLKDVCAETLISLQRNPVSLKNLWPVQSGFYSGLYQKSGSRGSILFLAWVFSSKHVWEGSFSTSWGCSLSIEYAQDQELTSIIK